MSKTKTTKRALLSSVLAMLLCVTMLIGTTFAWFTDTASTAVNKIQAGNLDIELEYSKNGTDWATVQGTDQLFNDVTLWEPGATSVVYLRLSNKGSLALKYRFSMAISDETPGTNVNGDPFKLSDYIQFSFIEGQSTKFASREEALTAAGVGTVLSAQNAEGRAHDEVGTMNAGANARYFALVVFMPETVGNVANYKKDTTPPEIKLGLNLVATQLASESDSFDNQYDGGANWNGDYMTSSSAVVTAPAAGQPMEIVLNNNSPASVENSTALTMASVSDVLAGKEVEFKSTSMNVDSASSNFSVATGANVEVAALKLEMKVDGVATSNLGGTATITTYIQPGLSNVNVTYVGTGDQPTDVQYDPATGKLSFKTNHFSDYVVTAKAPSVVEGVYEINSAADLFAFAKEVNKNRNTFSGVIVKLMADIDLAGMKWAPVGQTGGYSATTYFQGTFDGNGKTIKNLNVPASTWEAGSDQGKNFATGFFGFVDVGTTTIKDVTFDNATVEGHHWVGVAAGYMTGTVSGVKVKNSTVTSTYKNGEADGDKAGGVVGYLNSGSVTGCTVTGSTITAIRDCGSVVGYSAGTVTGNTAENCTVYYSTDNDEQIGGEIAGKRANGVSDNTATNVTVIKQLLVSTPAELSAALNATYTSDITIKLANDIDLSGIEWGVHALKGTNNSALTIDGNGKTIYGLTSSEYNNINGFNSNGLVTSIMSSLSSVTFKNLTVSGANLTNNGGWNAATGIFVGDINTVKVTFDTCTVTGANVTSNAYAAGFVGYVQDVYATDPNLSCPITLKNCTVSNSTFEGSDATGALVGLNNGATKITGATVTGNTIKGGNGYSAAALVGTAVVSTTATGVTASDNNFVINGSNYLVNNATYGYIYYFDTYSVNGTGLN